MNRPKTWYPVAHCWVGCGLGLACLVALAGAPEHRAVVCHVDYGGESQAIAAPPVSSPYAVTGVEVGSYFLFRVVNQTAPPDLASVKVYTYANHDTAAAPIHQAQFSWTEVARPPSQGGHGFTGLHWVYEPVRDGELRYWCELAHTSNPMKGHP